jgi:hypothetical protein
MVKNKSRTTNVGDVVYITAKVSVGMFPSERYFFVKTKPPIAGYVADSRVFGNAIMAVVAEVTQDGFVVALPGEASRNNLVRIPRSLVSRRAEA